MDCSNEFYLKQPDTVVIRVDGNVSFNYGALLWANRSRTIPTDLTGFTGRGAIGPPEPQSGSPLALMTVAVIMTATETAVTATIPYATVVTLPRMVPLPFDISFDNGDYSFTLTKGHIVVMGQDISSP